MTRRPGRHGLLWTLLLLGHRVGWRDGLGGAVHRLGIGVVAIVVVLIGSLFLSIDAVYSTRTERLGARTPVLVGEPSGAAFARWAEQTDSVQEDQFSVVYLAPTRADAPPPPGLPRWPEPGEAFLSPALLKAADEMGARYGVVAGEVGADGLADPNERLVYLRPVSDEGFNRIDGARSSYVVSWGVDPSLYSDPQLAPRFWGNLQHDRPAAELYWLLVVVVCLPASALIVVTVRIGAERRDRRIAILRAVGASRWNQAAVLAGEVALPTVAGASVGIALATLTTVTGVTLPATAYEVAARDLAAIRAQLPLLWLSATALLVAAAVVGQLWQRHRRGNRPAAVVYRIGRWATYAFAFFMAIALAGVIYRGGAGIASYLIGLTGALATLPLVAGRVAAAVGRLVARHGRRSGIPAAIVGGRWLAARPNVLARLSAALVMGLCLATVSQISFTQLDAALDTDREVSRRIGHAVVEVRARWDSEEVARFASAVDPNGVLYVRDTDDGGVEIAGTCETLTQLGDLSGCPVASTPMETAYTRLNATGQVLRQDSLLSASVMSVATVDVEDPAEHLAGIIVLNSSGAQGVERVKQTAYATLSMPMISLPGEFALTGTAAWAGLADWLIDFGAWGLAILFFAGILAAVGVFLTVARELGSLAGHGAGRKLFLGVAMWNLTVPLTVSVVISAVVAAGLGRMLIELARTGSLDIQFLSTASVVGFGMAAAVGLLCGEGAARRAWSWRPTGD